MSSARDEPPIDHPRAAGWLRAVLIGLAVVGVLTLIVASFLSWGIDVPRAEAAQLDKPHLALTCAWFTAFIALGFAIRLSNAEELRWTGWIWAALCLVALLGCFLWIRSAAEPRVWPGLGPQLALLGLGLTGVAVIGAAAERLRIVRYNHVPSGAAAAIGSVVALCVLAIGLIGARPDHGVISQPSALAVPGSLSRPIDLNSTPWTVRGGLLGEYQGLLITSTVDCRYSATDIATHAERWTYQVKNVTCPRLVDVVAASAELAAGVLYYPAQDRDVILDAATGKPQRQQRHARTSAQIVAGWPGSVAVYHDGATDDSTQVVDPRTGRIRYTVHSKSGCNPVTAVAGEALALLLRCSPSDETVLEVSRTDGHTIRSIPVAQAYRMTAIGGELLISTVTGTVSAYDPGGHLRWTASGLDITTGELPNDVGDAFVLAGPGEAEHRTVILIGSDGLVQVHDLVTGALVSTWTPDAFPQGETLGGCQGGGCFAFSRLQIIAITGGVITARRSTADAGQFSAGGMLGGQRGITLVPGLLVSASYLTTSETSGYLRLFA